MSGREGEAPTAAEIGLVAAALISAHNASDAVLHAGFAERARQLLVSLDAIRPTPVTAPPLGAPEAGLREDAAVWAALVECAEAWEPDARLVGDIRARDIARAARAALSAAKGDPNA